MEQKSITLWNNCIWNCKRYSETVLHVFLEAIQMCHQRRTWLLYFKVIHLSNWKANVGMDLIQLEICSRLGRKLKLICTFFIQSKLRSLQRILTSLICNWMWTSPKFAFQIRTSVTLNTKMTLLNICLLPFHWYSITQETFVPPGIAMRKFDLQSSRGDARSSWVLGRGL